MYREKGRIERPILGKLKWEANWTDNEIIEMMIFAIELWNGILKDSVFDVSSVCSKFLHFWIFFITLVIFSLSLVLFSGNVC